MYNIKAAPRCAKKWKKKNSEQRLIDNQVALCIVPFKHFNENLSFLIWNCRTLAQHCHNVERLDLSDCKKITDLSTQAISKHCSKLTSINLESCANITDLSLKAISDGCPVSII